MSDSSFIGYVGEADFHDGTVLSVEQQGNSVRVRIRGASRIVFVVEFDGVRAVRTTSPEGMLLYALSELGGEPPVRRFVFANWDDDSKATLEVDAESLAIREE